MEYIVIYQDNRWDSFFADEFKIEKGKIVFYKGMGEKFFRVSASIKSIDVIFILEFKNGKFIHIYDAIMD